MEPTPATKSARKPTPAKPPSVRIVLSPPMDDADVRKALAAMPDEHPAWRGILHLVDREIENAIAQVSMPELAERPGAMAHVAGGIEWLRSFRYRLEAVREEGRKE